MTTFADAFKKAGKYTLTSHAKERIRQRVGIGALEAQISWISASIATAKRSHENGKQTHYFTDAWDIVCDGLTVVTVIPLNNETSYADRLTATVAKEIRKLLLPQERLLRKAEIEVAELTLNQLKARNPKTKELIGKRLVEAIDAKQRIADEVFAIRKAAKHYGVDV